MSLTSEQIIHALSMPEGNVKLSWPLIQSALKIYGVDQHATQVAAAATVAVETGNFMPITERLANPAKQGALAKAQQRYYPWIGRGYIQLTWMANYKHYGDKLGLNLVDHPEWACDPAIAAKILALYFKENGIHERAMCNNWLEVRRRVNGGTNGWEAFKRNVDLLLEEAQR